MSVKYKLALSFISLFTIIIIISVYSYLQIKKGNSYIEDIYKVKMKSIENLFRFYRNATNASNSILLIKIDIDKKDKDSLLGNSRKAYVLMEDALKSFNIIKKNIKSDSLPDLQKSMEDLVSEIDTINKLIMNNEKEKLLDEIDVYLDKTEEMKDILLNVIDDIQFGAKEYYDQTSANNKRSIIILVSAIAIGIIVFITLSLILERSLIKPIRNTTEMLKDIAEGEGDLTKEIEVKAGRKDEISSLANYFNQFVSKLEKIIKKVMDHSNENKEETKKITVMMEQLDQTASILSDIVSSLSSAIEEMNSNVHVVAENSNNLAEMSEDIAIATSKGSRNVEDSIISINNIGEETSQLIDIFEKFNESVNKIQEVVTAINDIADQTNLLALNAAIEAARAGEHGRGFAVVADEVRKLAGKTSDSTKEIEKIAKDITMQSKNVQQKIDTVNEGVSVGTGKISEVQNVFNMISNMIKELKSKIAEINLSIKEQSVAMDELAVQTDKVLQSANDIKSAIDIGVNTINNLEKTVENLDRLVGVFKVRG